MLQKWPLFYYHYYNYYSIEMGEKSWHTLPSAFLFSLKTDSSSCSSSAVHTRADLPRTKSNVYNHRVFWGCTCGGVYVPFIYLHARWVTVGDSGLCCWFCVTSVEPKLTSLCGGFATTGKWWRKLVVVSNWILIFHQLHRVTSGQFNKKAPFKTLLIYMRSQIHKTSALS